jgi:betaine-homocysteine S-methyltransferase
MLPLIAGVREAVDVDVAALPVPYPTTEEEPSFQSLTDPNCNCLPGDGRPFPTALDPFYSNRYEIAQFAREAYELGVRYLGVCCGAAPHFIRSMAEALGRYTPASAYGPDMSKHAFLGSDPQLHAHNQQYAAEL